MSPRARSAASLAALTALSAVLVATFYASFGGSGCSERFTDGLGNQIFEGVDYGCERLASSEEGRGIVHWVRVDLNAPGIELYVTPLNPSAIEQGWQYRLQRVGTVLNDEELAVAINGALFTSVPTWRPRLPGDLAHGVETVVSNHVVSHVWEHTYLLWFDDRLVPTLEMTKPPRPEVLSKAKWAVGGQGIGLRDGKIRPGISRLADSRTAVAIDPDRKLLFLAVGEHVSPRLILQKLADHGARHGMLLDGGNSTSMALGKGAQGLGPQALFGGWWPVATHFGVRARPAHIKAQ